MTISNLSNSTHQPKPYHLEEKSALTLLKGYFEKGFTENDPENWDWWFQTFLKVLGARKLYFLQKETIRDFPETSDPKKIQNRQCFLSQFKMEALPYYWVQGHPFIEGDFLAFSLPSQGNGGSLLIGDFLPGHLFDQPSQLFLDELHKWICFIDTIHFRSQGNLSQSSQEKVDALEQALESTRQELQSDRNSNRYSALKRLAGGVAHEFNNLVSIILGHVELAKIQNNTDAEAIPKVLDLTSKTCDRMTQTINRLLTFSQKKLLSPKETDLNKLISQTVASFQEEAHNRQITMQTDFEELPHIWVDQEGFSHCLYELILNALQASEVNSSISLVTRHRPHHIEFFVLDQGKGISEENLEDIFEPFYTTKGALGGGPETGNGLGLSTVQAIISQHRGSVISRSQEGQGSLFGFTIPIKDEFIDTHQLENQDVRILIIESDDKRSQKISNILQDKHFQIKHTEQSIEALSMIDSWSPHLLLVSEHLNDMTGLELIETIQFYVNELPIVLITQDIQSTLVRQATHLGVKHYVDDTHLETTLLEEISLVLTEKNFILNEESSSPLSSSALHILIVDDEPNIGKLLTRFIEPQGHHVSFVTHPDEALKTIKDNNYDLLLIDLVMPELNGSQLTRRCREQGFTNSVAWMTGFQPEEDIEKTQEELNVRKVFQKPFEMSEINQFIKEIENEKDQVV